MEERKVLPQDMVRHLAACLVLGLEALHKCEIIYRALSPELVFCDSRYGVLVVLVVVVVYALLVVVVVAVLLTSVTCSTALSAQSLFSSTAGMAC